MLVLILRFVGALLWLYSSILTMDNKKVDDTYQHEDIVMVSAASCFALSSVWMLLQRFGNTQRVVRIRQQL